MRIVYDPARRAATLAQLGLDFAAAAEVFAGRHATLPDDRQDYGEPRYITAGRLGGRLVVLIWTPRGNARQVISQAVISMRHADAKEERRWQQHLG